VAGERQKPPGTTRRGRPAKHEAAPLASSDALANDPPAPPASFSGGKLSKAAVRAWAEFWTTPQALAVDVSDLPRLEHWARLLSERGRCWREYARQPMVDGFNGQPVLNPHFKVLQTIDAEIERAEEHFGMTPRARFRLGIAAGEAKRTAAELTAGLGDDDGGGAETMPEFQ